MIDNIKIIPVNNENVIDEEVILNDELLNIGDYISKKC